MKFLKIFSHKKEIAELNHYADFLKAIIDNKPDAVCGDLKEAILSGDLCHFGNISYRVGTPGDFDEARDVLKGLNVPPMVFERLNAMGQNLDENQFARDITIGSILHHTDDPKAEKLLSTPYRKGYVLPDVAGV